MFVHAMGVFHILFNMLVLWWFGAELELRWGSRFFLTYYLVCGVGAGAIYLIGTLGYALITGNVLPLAVPLVGASGATYGLLLAYGILFGERIIYFMMLFPMKAKYFTMIIGAVELFDHDGFDHKARKWRIWPIWAGWLVGFLYLSFLTGYRRDGRVLVRPLAV